MQMNMDSTKLRHGGKERKEDDGGGDDDDDDDGLRRMTISLVKAGEEFLKSFLCALRNGAPSCLNLKNITKAKMHNNDDAVQIQIRYTKYTASFI